MRHARLVAAAAAVAVLALAPLPASALDRRFESARPGASPGSWQAVLTGGGPVEKARETLRFTADGADVAATLEPLDGGRLAVTLSGVPAGAEVLAAVAVGPKGQRLPLAALRLGPSHAAVRWDDWVIYHVMIEGFRNGNRANDNAVAGWKHPSYAGGDLAGLVEKVPYIRSLGMTAVWLSPVFLSGTSHGYDVRNYYAIADQWGVPGDRAASLQLFRTFVARAHEAGLKVVLDVPLNHASKLYELPEGDPGNLKPRSTGPIQPAEKLWESWGGNYRYWSFDHAPTRRFLIDVALHWIRDEGVDGLRLDYVRGVPHDFWAELYAEVKKVKPGAFLVGECWADEAGPDRNAVEISQYQREVPGKGRQLDSLLDFPLQSALTAVFAHGASAVQLEERLQADLALYGPGTSTTPFLDNHDLARFLSWAKDPERLVAAVTFLAALSGPEAVFYGTETGLVGTGAPKGGFTDAGRVPMPWDALDEPLIARVRAVFEARRAHPALSSGGRLPLRAEKDLLVMAKVAPAETALVGVNLAGSTREVEVDLEGLAPTGTTLRSLLGTSTVTPVPGSRKLRWRLPALSTSVLAP